MAASIITSVKGDVTYDGISDTVSLIGVQFGDSNAWQQMSLVIQNGATGRITAIALPEDAGLRSVPLAGQPDREEQTGHSAVPAHRGKRRHHQLFHFYLR